MSMRNCKKCYNNTWSYEFDDDTRIVTATCKSCNSVTSFNAKKKNPPRTTDYKMVFMGYKPIV